MKRWKRKEWITGILIALAVGMLPALGVPAPARADEVKTLTIHGKTYTLEYVKKVMQQYKAQDGRYKVAEFLKDNGIELITKDTYKSNVYGSKKPVIVMPFVYDDYTGPSMREAIILKLLKEQFGDKIEVYGIDVHNRDGSRNEAFDLFFSEIRKFTYDHMDIKEVKESIEAQGNKFTGAAPSLLLYAPYDILRGETPTQNDGKMKLIDVVRGGPESAKELFEMYSDMTEFWIWNVIDDGKKHTLKRSFNTYKWYKVPTN